MIDLILASKSPRRKELLRGMGLSFEVMQQDADESYPPGMPAAEVAVHIAANKARAFEEAIHKKGRTDNKVLGEDKLLLAADTIVVLEGEILGKPADSEMAARMLEKLSGKKHEVITGVALLNMGKRYNNGELHTFSSMTSVYFAPLSMKEIRFYIDNYRPFDKAGAYGIQEWIGYNKITRIEGSYTNVVGLPTEMLYEYLNRLYPQAFSSSGRI